MFIRNESFGEFLRKYKVVSALIFINLVLYMWTDWFGFLGGDEIYWLGIGNNVYVAFGEYWRLVTPIFLHAGLMHVAFNSFSLFLFGPALERMLGRGTFLMVYLGTGIFANVVYYFLGDPRAWHLGASGAVYGLFGIYLYMVLVRKDLINSQNAQLITVIIVIGVIMTFINPNINIIAHIFGLIAGALLAPLTLSKVTRESYYQNVHDQDDVGFDPDRWKKRERFRQAKWVYIAGGFGLMVLFFYVVDLIFF
ncbi:rhomboid family intramembrane serine protease [Paenalkalicoccus suaedae]|uniref:Rhomboid family intramembrane serine protease n=2 Tax=Paenalkalicoccus suaedae TaxID=2592382 RepID=A0A859FD98_9BACI|nr:rhomboid family intramembrane serine protease [Paenalkalicoccus suaedae]